MGATEILLTAVLRKLCADQLVRFDGPNQNFARAMVTRLRDKTTPLHQFRAATDALTYIMGVTAMADQITSPVKVTTPLDVETDGEVLNETVGLVSVLRAGLGPFHRMQEIMPESLYLPIGLERDHETSRASTYYCGLKGQPVDLAVVLEPMLATGGSAREAISMLTEWGVKRIKLISFFGVAEGISTVLSEFPRTQIYLGVLDPVLTTGDDGFGKNYISPGCGDFGDRVCGTYGERWTRAAA